MQQENEDPARPARRSGKRRVIKVPSEPTKLCQPFSSVLADLVSVTPETVVAAVSSGNSVGAVAALRHLTESAPVYGLPVDFLIETAIALETDNWEHVAVQFVRRQFIGPKGKFLLVGPYSVRRSGGKTSALTAVYGQSIPCRKVDGLGAQLQVMLGALNQEIPEVIPVTILAACGMVGNEGGEAFIVPDGWEFPGSEGGPSLNDMGEQRRRLTGSGFECIRQIFGPSSAELLLSALENEQQGILLQSREYQFHEAGHASGFGLRCKLGENLLTTPWSRAIEEYRADGVEFELATHLLPIEEAGQLITANLCIRFGIDAHRLGGLECDTDVNASLLTFDRLFANGALDIEKGRLVFVDPSHRGLVRAVEQQRVEAIRLTLDEMHVKNKTAIGGLYGSVPLSRAGQMLFRTFIIEPCRGLFRELR